MIMMMMKDCKKSSNYKGHISELKSQAKDYDHDDDVGDDGDDCGDDGVM